MDSRARTLEHERIASRPKHWVRLTTACNNKCLFCLDMDTPRNVYLATEDIEADIRRGHVELGAAKVILSGGEASVHPLFSRFIRFALEIGYERVQTVTNGLRYGDRRFFDEVMDAGLGEITFSLHGHDAALHDRLVQTPGSFELLMKGLLRAVRHRDRHGWPIVNIDVVINSQNVGVLDRIVELGVSVGVKEYDLLHVIPQAEAYRNREQLFYEVREHLPVLQKVFRLNRRDDFHIWTNRFPVAYLEGLEDLIQDPHKMIDEVRGRRFHVRRYLDSGTPLDCRQPERCEHCFIEPFCTTMERTIEAQNGHRVDLWHVGGGSWSGPLPFGACRLGVIRERYEDLPTDYPLLVETSTTELPEPGDVILVAKTAEQCAAWLGHDMVVRLNPSTAPWLLANVNALHDLRIHQPTWTKTEEAVAGDLRDPAGFFRQLKRRVPVSGLPACLAPGMELVRVPRRLDAALFHEGRLHWEALAAFHVEHHYRARSVRCDDCPVSELCEGISIHMIRAQGLGLCQPLEGDHARDAREQLSALPKRIAQGLPPQPVAASLPGHPPPSEPPEDPLRQPNGLRRSDFLRGGREVV
ncbi:MAG TPA: radical SAM protein [Myxococcota bacterium]|nr:radical SAM protein [Myxococcota bacterium]